MTIEIKTKQWAVMLLLTGLFSCTKQVVIPETIGNNPVIQPSVPTEQLPDTVVKVLVPHRITGKNMDLKLSYTAQQQLRSVVNGEDSTVITYNSKLLAREISQYSKGQLVKQTIITLNAEGLPDLLEQFKLEKNGSTFISASKLTYDQRLRLKELIKTNPQKNKIQELQFSYLENKTIEIWSAMDNQRLVFDQLKGQALFKNAKYAWLFALEGLPAFFFSDTMNLYSIEGSDAGIFNCAYNSAGYPQSMEWKTGAQTSPWQISYLEIPQP